MRIVVLCSLLMAAFALHMEKSTGWKKKPTKHDTVPESPRVKANNANPEVSIASPRQRVGSLADTSLGLNVPAWMDHDFMEQYGTPAMNSSFNSIRFPGGSWANKYIWNKDFEEFPYFANISGVHYGPDKLDTKGVVELAKSTGAKLLIQANYAVARVYGAEKAGKLAADWVRYIRENLTYPLAYVEVGNENYAKWEVPYANGPKHHKVDGKLYGADFNVIQKHIKQVSPDVQVGAVLSTTEQTKESTMSANEISGDWNENVLKQCGKNADFVTVHEYFPENTPIKLFQEAGYGPESLRQKVDEQVKRFVPHRKGRMPIALTEFNLQMTSHNQTVNMANGLFLAKFLGECMENGIFMTQLWALRTKWIGKPAYERVLMQGKKKITQHVRGRGGEYGIFSANQPGVTRHTPRATLYTSYIYKRIFSEGRHMVKATSDADDLMVYAAGKENGDDSVGMVLVNLGPQQKNVKLSGITMTDSAKMWTLEGEANRVDDKRFMLNQVKTSNSTAEYGGPWPLEDVPAKPINSNEIVVKPYSVVGVLA